MLSRARRTAATISTINEMFTPIHTDQINFQLIGGFFLHMLAYLCFQNLTARLPDLANDLTFIGLYAPSSFCFMLIDSLSFSFPHIEDRPIGICKRIDIVILAHRMIVPSISMCCLIYAPMPLNASPLAFSRISFTEGS